MTTDLETKPVPFADMLARMAEHAAAPRFACTVCGKERTEHCCMTCRDREDRAQRVEEARREAAARRIAQLDAATPSRYRWAAFDAPELAQRVSDKAAVDKARKLVGSPMVTLVGAAGAGKTSLACAIAKATVLERVCPGVEWLCFAYAPTLCLARAHHGLGEGEPQLVAEAMSERYVVIVDDLGQETDNAWSQVLREVIDLRHREELPTIVTTFMSPAEVAKRHGDGLARRVFEGGYISVKGRAK